MLPEPSREVLLGTCIDNYLPERFRSGHAKHRAAYRKEPHVRPMGANMELYVQQKTGDEVRVLISISPLMTPTGMLTLAVVRRWRDDPKDDNGE